MKQQQAVAGDERGEVLLGYGGRHEARATVARPATVGELRAVLLRALRDGRRVTLRGGGQSIDDRAIGGDLVISTERLDSIEVDAAAARVTVGPGRPGGRSCAPCPGGSSRASWSRRARPPPAAR